MEGYLLFEDHAASALLLGEVDLLLHEVRDGRQQRRLDAVAFFVRHEGEGGEGAIGEGEAGASRS